MMEAGAIHIRKPLVSVIMPAHNAEQHIGQAIRSVQQQTVEDWELIILDDCSTDATGQIVTQEARKDSRIRLYRNTENLGVAKSRNRGLALRRGDHVAFLDSDDTWHPEKLELQLNCFRQTDADLVYTAYTIVNATDNALRKAYAVPAQITYLHLLKENVIGCSTVMIRGEMAEKFRFPEDTYHEDYVLWLAMLRDGCKAVGLQQILMDYCYSKQSKSGKKGRAARKRWEVYRRYCGFSVVKSMWYFGCYAVAGLRKYKSA